MKQKFWQLLPAILFFLLFAVLLVLLLFGPRETRSLTEGRALAGRPVMDLHDPAALTQAFTDYAADHLPLREDLLRLDTRVQVALGKRSVRDALIADDGWLFLRVYRADSWQRERLLSALDHAMQDCPDVSFVYGVLPHKTDALPERTAPYLDSRIGTENRQTLEAAMEERLPGLLAVDVAGEFLTNYSASERESFYFKTDFHWNPRGAFAASADLAAAMQENGLLDGVVLPAAEDFAWQDLDCPYRGDLNRRFSYLFSMQEEIPYYSIRETSELQYYDAKDVEVPRESIWARGLQSGEEMQYNLLSTENLGFYRICNPNARSARRVLILKDSMEDRMTDYWAELFSEIIVIDPRSYLREESLPELVAEYDIDMALFLYHQNNLSEELIDFLNRGE